MNALRRRPLQIVGLAVKTYMGYWNITSIQLYARSDLGYGEVDATTRLRCSLRSSDLKR